MSFITNGFPEFTISVSPNYDVDDYLLMYPRMTLAINKAKAIINNDISKLVLIEVFPGIYTEDIELSTNIMIDFKPGAWLRGDVDFNNRDIPVIRVTGNPCQVDNLVFVFPGIESQSQKKYVVEILDGAYCLFNNPIISTGVRDTCVVIRKGGACYFSEGILFGGNTPGETYRSAIAAEGVMPYQQRVFCNTNIEGQTNAIYLFQPTLTESGTALILRGTTTYLGSLVFPEDDLLSIRSDHSGLDVNNYFRAQGMWKDHVNVDGNITFGFGSKPETLPQSTLPRATILNHIFIEDTDPEWIEFSLENEDDLLGFGSIGINNIPTNASGIYVNAYIIKNSDAGDVIFQLKSRAESLDKEIITLYPQGTDIIRECQFPIKMSPDHSIRIKVSEMGQSGSPTLTVKLILLGWIFGGFV